MSILSIVIMIIILSVIPILIVVDFNYREGDDEFGDSINSKNRKLLIIEVTKLIDSMHSTKK